MSEINSKVEYRNLIGFPNYEGTEIQLLKSNNSPFGYNNIDLQTVKNELGVEQKSIEYNNCIIEKSKA